MNQYDGDKARMDIGREDYNVYLQGAEDSPAIKGASEFGFWKATDLHVQNFLDCVRTRKTPTAPMRLGFPGGPGCADGEHLDDAWTASQVERGDIQGRGHIGSDPRQALARHPVTNTTA